jgi:5'-nucleotidase
MGREIVYVDMDGVLVDFPPTVDDLHPSIREKCLEWVNEDPDNNDWTDFDGLFASLLPKDGIQDIIERLEARFEVYLLSTAPWKNHSSLSDKRRWIAKHLPNLPEKRLILSHRKDLNRGRYLIDDRPKNGACMELERGISKGFGDFDGQEWLHFGCSGCDDCRHPHPNWDSVLTYLDC